MKVFKSILLALLIVPFVSVRAETAINDDIDISDIDDSNDYIAEYAVIDDPFEPVNRVFFAFNEVVDDLILEPVAILYEMVMPKWGRERVSSVVSNLKEPVYFIDHALAGDFDAAEQNMGRFISNSIMGLGGLFDIAAEAGIEPQETDFGLTLRSYGIGAGPYIVVPIAGSFAARDLLGHVADQAMHPWNYFFNQDATTLYSGIRIIEARQRALDVSNDIENIALDKYVTVRSIVYQNRK